MPGAVSDTCAFNPVCNAATAYLASGRGTSFAPWSSYDQDVYTKFIDPAQTAVTQRSGGTVTSAVLGECLIHAWTVVGRSELRNAADGKCLTDPNSGENAGSPVTVTRCADAKPQTWWLP